FASGNITHNLRHAFGSLRTGSKDTPSWARDFDARIADAVHAGDHDALVTALEREDADTVHPTPDHYLPLLYAAGAAGQGGRVSSPVTGFAMASISMRSIVFTDPAPAG